MSDTFKIWYEQLTQPSVMAEALFAVGLNTTNVRLAKFKPGGRKPKPRPKPYPHYQQWLRRLDSKTWTVQVKGANRAIPVVRMVKPTEYKGIWRELPINARA